VLVLTLARFLLPIGGFFHCGIDMLAESSRSILHCSLGQLALKPEKACGALAEWALSVGSVANPIAAALLAQHVRRARY
jgi:hypothetical protein